MLETFCIINKYIYEAWLVSGAPIKVNKTVALAHNYITDKPVKKSTLMPTHNTHYTNSINFFNLGFHWLLCELVWKLWAVSILTQVTSFHGCTEKSFHKHSMPHTFILRIRKNDQFLGTEFAELRIYWERLPICRIILLVKHFSNKIYCHQRIYFAWNRLSGESLIMIHDTLYEFTANKK